MFVRLKQVFPQSPAFSLWSHQAHRVSVPIVETITRSFSICPRVAWSLLTSNLDCVSSQWGVVDRCLKKHQATTWLQRGLINLSCASQPALRDPRDEVCDLCDLQIFSMGWDADMVILENSKDTLCRNVLIYGHCRYEDQGCAFNHDPNKTISPPSDR